MEEVQDAWPSPRKTLRPRLDEVIQLGYVNLLQTSYGSQRRVITQWHYQP
jgi:hypothetical protein